MPSKPLAAIPARSIDLILFYHFDRYKTRPLLQCFIAERREGLNQVFLTNLVLHLGQVISIFPLPLGTRTVCLQFGQE